MQFPQYRPRRMRRTKNLRRMIRETHIRASDLVYPLFVQHGQGVKEPIGSMPGIYRWSVDTLVREAEETAKMEIPAVLLFGVPAKKDEAGSEAYSDAGIVQQAIRALKKDLPELVVIADICLCEYTSHGHCGLVEQGEVKNDETLELLAETALAAARAGVDMVAPSDMMDGRVGYIREALDEEGFDDLPIMAYSAKYASAFYGPFRDAAGSAPQFGDRRAYQMDPCNGLEALREVTLDIEEGADIVMVKPALAYLDVIARVREETDLPLAAYNVSGEYSMIRAAAERGWIDYEQAVMETLTSIRRAGADIIITYHAKEAAKLIQSR